MNLKSKILNLIQEKYIDEYKLYKYLMKKITNKIFGEKNKKIIIDLLPELLEKTNDYNKLWLDILFFLESDEKNKNKLQNQLINNIDKVNYNESIYILESILNTIENLPLTNEQALLLINKITKCNTTIDYFTIERIYNLIEKTYPELTEVILKTFILNNNTCTGTLSLLIKLNKKELIYQNIDYIIEKLPNINFFQLLDKIKDNAEATKKVKEKIQNNQKQIVSNLIQKLYQRFNNTKKIIEKDQKNLETILEIIYMLIMDICKNEQVKVDEIQFLGGGTFSTVLGIGNKVIKIGNKRLTKTFPNIPYIIAPLLRKEFKINDDISFFVEVTEKADTKTKITEEEMYQLYKKIRDLGLIWIDIAPRNIGRLKRKNKVYWRQELPISEKVLELDEPQEKKELDTGELVIIDNDAIYDENTPNEQLSKISNQYQKEFEKRYQKEKQRIKQQSIETETIYIEETPSKKKK